MNFDSGTTGSVADPETSAKIATLESLLDNFPTPFFTVGRDLVITHMNRPLERLSGYSRDDVIGRMTCASVLSTPQCDTSDCLLKQSMENRLPISGVTRVVKNRDGREIPVVANASIITDRSGRVIGGFEAFRDISSIVEAQKEIEETRLQLIQAEKIASLGRLAAGVAHEINNPLAGILVYADVLMKEISSNSRWRGDLENIITQTLRCKQIVSNLLQFSRQSLGQRTPVDVNDLIGRCVELLAYQAMFQDVEIIQELQTDLPRIMADPGQLQQVFTNLIINAGDAMNGKGRLTISSVFDPQVKQVILRFADTGDGISKEIMDKIFEPFFTTKPPGKGTGLGLSVAYGVVQQYDGSIEAECPPGGGITFTVRLPLECPKNLNEIMEV
ncbi:MAG: PAS domain S-box protein [Desulfobacterales bacterium]|nr:PAS domain S-box protein [Desulfobacterales bacterium]